MFCSLLFKRVVLGPKRTNSGLKRAMVGFLGMMLVFSGFNAMFFTTPATACTQYWMPSTFTQSNGYQNTYVARSEDHAQRCLKTFSVQEPQGEKRIYQSEESGFAWAPRNADADINFKAPAHSYRYTYVRDLPGDWNGRDDAYSEAGINEKGLACTATLSTTYGDKIKATDPVGQDAADGGQNAADGGQDVADGGQDAAGGAQTGGQDVADGDVQTGGQAFGTGEYIDASIVLGECTEPRQAAELLGKLTSKFGAFSTDQAIIANSNEAWLFNALSGHEWIAFKLSNNQASVNPNLSNLTNYIDLNASTTLHSPGIIETARKAGMPVSFDAAGRFDYGNAYGIDGAEDVTPSGQLRYAQARAYLGAPINPARYRIDTSSDNIRENGIKNLAAADRTFYFTPSRRDFSTFDIVRATATRGENAGALNANADPDRLYAVGNNRTVESHTFQIRRHLDGSHLDPRLAIIQWEALSRDEFSVAIPCYSALLEKTSPYFSTKTTSTEHQGEESATEEDASKATGKAMEEEPENDLTYVLMDLNTLCYNNRDTVAVSTRAYLDAIQRSLIEQNDQVDALLQECATGRSSVVDAAGRQLSLEEVAYKAHATATKETYLKCKVLLEEIRDYLRESKNRATDAPPAEQGDGSRAAESKSAASLQTAANSFVPSDYDFETKSMKTSLRYLEGVRDPSYNVDPSLVIKAIWNVYPKKSLFFDLIF